MDGLYVPSRIILDFVFCFLFFVLKFCFQIIRYVLFVKIKGLFGFYAFEKHS